MAETEATEESATETGTAGSVPEETFSEAFIRGVKGALPMQVGFIPLSFILGTQGGQHGLSALGMALMVSFNFAGGSEFAAVALWSATPSFLVIFVTTGSSTAATSCSAPR